METNSSSEVVASVAQQTSEISSKKVEKSTEVVDSPKEKKIEAPKEIKTAEDMMTAIKAKYQNNKEGLTKMKGVSDASKQVMEMINKTPPDVQGLISHAGDVISYVFELFMNGDRSGESGVLNEIMGYDFDISSIKTEEDAQKWIDELTKSINDSGSDVIERFITLHTKSKVIDKKSDIANNRTEKEAEKITKKQRLLETVQPGDLVLIDYRNSQNVEAEIVNQALKGLSKSPFCHVGFVGEDKTLYHSTLAKKDGGAGVEKRGFDDYLSAKGNCTVMVIRPKNITKTQKEEMIARAENHVDNKKGYDNKAAIDNLSGGSIKSNKDTYNCGEYVYDVLSSIYPNLKIKNSALPASYTSQKDLDRHYLTKNFFIDGNYFTSLLIKLFS